MIADYSAFGRPLIVMVSESSCSSQPFPSIGSKCKSFILKCFGKQAATLQWLWIEWLKHKDLFIWLFVRDTSTWYKPTDQSKKPEKKAVFKILKSFSFPFSLVMWKWIRWVDFYHSFMLLNTVFHLSLHMGCFFHSEKEGTFISIFHCANQKCILSLYYMNV